MARLAQEDELDRTIQARWPTIAPSVGAIENDPRGTIRPAGVDADTAGRKAWAALTTSTRPSGAATGSPLVMGEILGTGGMGVVRLAEQVSLGRQVAVKTLRPELTTDGATMGLLREAWATASLEHPNVPPVYDMGLDADGRPLIVLRRIEGTDWGALLHDDEGVRVRFGAEDRLEWNLGILSQVCNAVRFAHSRGIVHRDLKPDNVMIGAFGEVYVLDWGLAVSVRDDGTGRVPLAAQVRDLCGTPCYMAPEMLGGPGDTITERTDIYLLGGILHEILTGVPPHDATDALGIMRSVISSRPALDGVPSELADVCRKAMAPEPADRHADVEELRIALLAFLRHRGSARLASEAEQRAVELRAALASPLEDEAAQRLHLYHLLGECRFGFRAALEAWPENPDATRGLTAAVSAVVEHELAQRNPSGAASLLAGVADPAPALVARVQAATAEARAEQQRLEALGRDRDHRVGQGRRLMFVGGLGLVWALTPLIQFALVRASPAWETYRRLLVWPAGSFLAVLFVAVWQRRVLLSSGINREFTLSALLVPAATLFLAVGTWLAGIPAMRAIVMLPFLWFTVCAMLTITMERKMWPTAAGYLLVFFAAARWPGARYPLLAVSNLLMVVNAVWIWGRGIAGRPE